ncbi:MAG: hypothetical protein DRJ66_05935 [Thermoprotei archaeon]|nr:MAG: hypothetical protein DRJ66_05935 [Thermoprotei archaeon]RLF20752.1 MAG: hypothetical protein DRZ82_01210 [Thermoprotei archaeon]
MSFIDVHCHIYEFDDVVSTINEALSKGVNKIIGVGEDPESNRKLLEIHEMFSDVVYPSIGFHPWEAANASRDDINEFKLQVEKYSDIIVGIGEVGIDKRFVRSEEKIKRQIEVFEVAVRLAREYDLPLNIHCMKTEREVLRILIENDIVKAIFHWYTGSYEVLREIIQHGYYVSVNLSLRYSSRARGVAERAPLGLILLESDSPYYFKGEYATPASVAKVAELLARIKEVDLKTVAHITTRSAQLLFSI